VPSFSSSLKSSFFIPGSSARRIYASLLSRISTGGYHVDTLGVVQDRPKLSPNKSLIRDCILLKPSNGSHLTNSIIKPPLDLVFSTQKLSMGTGTVNHLTEAHTMVTVSSARQKIPLKLTETIALLTLRIRD